ncbi:MAG TPA: cytochrome C oxidase subunit IV family protein [Methylocystis sp.]|nr:cytochrome C oxidase subunit IV family protein [Methylocystis sp.]
MTATTEVSVESAAHGHAARAETTKPAAEAHGHGQQHPLKLYLLVWALLFILSTFSYLIDYFDLQGMTRWSLIILFMLLKAGFIIAIFMHMAWERLALVVAILLPPMALLVFIGLMNFEGDYTNGSRETHFTPATLVSSPSKATASAPAHE